MHKDAAFFKERCERLQKELNDERILNSILKKREAKDAETATGSKNKLGEDAKEGDIQQELQEKFESLEIRDQKEVAVQFDYLISQSGKLLLEVLMHVLTYWCILFQICLTLVSLWLERSCYICRNTSHAFLSGRIMAYDYSVLKELHQRILK